MTRCPMCQGIGWILDANGAMLLQKPRQAELIRCIYPTCTVSGTELASVVFKGPVFRHVARHPTKGYIMSVST